MAERDRKRLTDAGIARLRPREREYTVWDRELPGLGVRVRTSGARSYVLLQTTEGSSRRVFLGPASTKPIAEIRRECHAHKAGPEPEREAAPTRRVPLFRDFVSGEWKEAHFDRYKPSTRRMASYLLKGRLLPGFGSRPLDRITASQVRRWFDAFSRTAPGNANRGLAVLRQIMNFAVARGHIEKNPTRDIRFNRRPKLIRFLSREEIARLHRALDEQARRGERFRQQADIIRLLLLTGCRRGEILTLRRSAVDDGKLALGDSKTGPRTVSLNSQARRILDRQPRAGSPFVFPSPLDASRPHGPELRVWYRARRNAGLEDVRLHDLRHTFASQAVISGIPVPVVSRMLGHSSVRMTLRYAHLGDREIEAAAERVGNSIGEIMGL